VTAVEFLDRVVIGGYARPPERPHDWLDEWNRKRQARHGLRDRSGDGGVACPRVAPGSPRDLCKSRGFVLLVSDRWSCSPHRSETELAAPLLNRQ